MYNPSLQLYSFELNPDLSRSLNNINIVLTFCLFNCDMESSVSITDASGPTHIQN